MTPPQLISWRASIAEAVVTRGKASVQPLNLRNVLVPFERRHHHGALAPQTGEGVEGRQEMVGSALMQRQPGISKVAKCLVI